MAENSSAARVVSTQPQPPGATASDSSQPAPEDLQFFEFSKRYIPVLTGVASLPILSSILGVVAPPADQQQLTILSSFLCVAAFGSCFMLKGVIAWFSLSPKLWRRLIPFLATVGLLGTGTYLAARYYSYRVDPPKTETARASQAEDRYQGATKDVTWHRKVATTGPYSEAITLTVVSATATEVAVVYFAVFPILVFALGIILLVAYTQNQGHRIESLLDSNLSSTSIASRVKGLISNYSDFYERARSNEPFGRIGDELLEELEAQAGFLGQATVEVTGARTARLQGLLLEKFSKRFEAVSARDLDFWLRRDSGLDNVDDSRVAREYFRLNAKASAEGTKLTRIFLFDDDDLLKRTADVTAVLQEQSTIGVQWGVVPYQELDPVLLGRDGALDFALFNTDAAVSFFRDYRELTRKFRAVFHSTEENTAVIREQRDIHTRLVKYCWLATTGFRQFYENEDDLKCAIRNFSMARYRRLGIGPTTAEPLAAAFSKAEKQFDPAPPGSDAGPNGEQRVFFLELRDGESIATKVEMLKQCRVLSKDFYEKHRRSENS